MEVPQQAKITERKAPPAATLPTELWRHRNSCPIQSWL